MLIIQYKKVIKNAHFFTTTEISASIFELNTQSSGEDTINK